MSRGRVLITGAGTGIGRACALYLAEEGFHIIAAGRREEPLAALEKERPGQIIGVTLDVTNNASVEAAIAKISPVDHLVNNAGVSVMGPVEAISTDEWRRQFEVNVFGVATMIRAVLPQMRQRGTGRIVQIGSVTGRVVPPFMGCYGASKHALEGMTDALRREVAKDGIHVSLVRSGFVNTDFGTQEKASLEANSHPAYEDDMKRFGTWHHEKGHKVAPSPVVVAQAVERALTDAVPKTRYACPAQAQRFLFLRNVLPARWVDGVIRRTIGL
ncbi:MAG: SDR family oxidoreductase [Pseudomonadota bacterium]